MQCEFKVKTSLYRGARRLCDGAWQNYNKSKCSKNRLEGNSDTCLISVFFFLKKNISIEKKTSIVKRSFLKLKDRFKKNKNGWRTREMLTPFIYLWRQFLGSSPPFFLTNNHPLPVLTICSHSPPSLVSTSITQVSKSAIDRYVGFLLPM